MPASSTSLKRPQVSTAPREYVSKLYDGYADRFDRHLKVLQYKTPELLNALVSKCVPGRSFTCGLDLGCGTGLSGLSFRDKVETFHGVDL